MQIEITETMPLHKEKGKITKEGWAREPYWIYDRKKTGFNRFFIKEWDYFAIISHKNKIGLTLSLSDLGYLSLFTYTFLDFEKKFLSQNDIILLLTMGNIGLGEDSKNSRVFYKKGDTVHNYELQKNRIVIHSELPYLRYSDNVPKNKKTNFVVDLILTIPDSHESMNIITTWKENRRLFYYNRKINCLRVEGSLRNEEKEFVFDKNTDFGCLDWGRGVWAREVNWYWGSASGIIDGVPSGFNIGYGFSDRSVASENCIIYDGKIHKLDQVEFHIDKKDYLKPWKFTSNDKRFEMDFYPVIDRKAYMDYLIVKTNQHQVFGYFNGEMILDNGKKIIVKDLLGFAEDVYNLF